MIPQQSLNQKKENFSSAMIGMPIIVVQFPILLITGCQEK